MRGRKRHRKKGIKKLRFFHCEGLLSIDERGRIRKGWDEFIMRQQPIVVYGNFTKVKR